jgi:hypothetical protein
MKEFVYSGIPTHLCAVLQDRLVRAGFADEMLEITSIPINHGDKDLLFVERVMFLISLIFPRLFLFNKMINEPILSISD